jgi:hypothetical protein
MLVRTLEKDVLSSSLCEDTGEFAAAFDDIALIRVIGKFCLNKQTQPFTVQSQLPSLFKKTICTIPKHWVQELGAVVTKAVEDNFS